MARRRDILLGGYDTPQSRAEYDRVIAEWVAADRRLEPAGAPAAASDARTVAEVVCSF
jgi:hypothetical protein